MDILTLGISKSNMLDSIQFSSIFMILGVYRRLRMDTVAILLV
jgi:hypothetical protein